MGSEVKIIVVNPSRSIQVFDELRQVRKNEKAQIKDQIKQNKVIQRVEEKARKDATKAYEKKLKAQRKARLK
jgi:polyribonucleotide nucleotidyltransferase